MKVFQSVVPKRGMPLGELNLTQARLLMQKRLSDRPAPVRRPPTLAARAFVFALLLGLVSVHGWAQQSDQQQMRGLDDQVQEIKSDVLSIAA